tara:strand:+ start:7791 stop:8633 length:843 start_codon:yes stop_codon:yes gene_type:complete
MLQQTYAASPFFLRGSADKKQAVSEIPFSRLDAAAKRKVNSVVENTSVFKRMTPQIIDCDPRYYMFLIRHPEVIVSIWQMMDATDMRITRKGPLVFNADDGEGTVGTLEFLYGDQKVHVLYGEGAYTGSLTKRPIRADCLLVLHSNFTTDKSGRTFVKTQLDMFVDVKNVGVDLIARTFQHMIGNTTDLNFAETANFITKLSRTTEENGPGVQHLAMRLTEINEPTRREFARHAGAVFQRARGRDGEPVAPVKLSPSNTQAVSLQIPGAAPTLPEPVVTN